MPSAQEAMAPETDDFQVQNHLIEPISTLR